MRENGGRDDSKWPPLALWPYSAEKIFLIRVCRGLRAAPNAAFTSGGRDRKHWMHTLPTSLSLPASSPLSQQPSPLRHGLRRATSPKGRGSGETAHFALEPETLPPPLKPSPLGDRFPPAGGKPSALPHTLHLSWKHAWTAKGSPFGRAAERSEAERASPLPAARMFPQETSAANAACLHGPTL